jgi:type IV secretion system protein VirB6
MSAACSAPAGPTGFIGSVSAFMDCQAEMFGSGAFGALAAPGSTLSLAVTGLLTLFIAFIGYNLLVGRGLGVRSGTLAIVKVGAVLALATSWPAYHTLVYGIVTDAPEQIVAEIARPAALPGSDGSLVARLDLADVALQQLAILGPGNPPPDQIATLPPPPMAGFDAFALGGSRILFLLSALAGLVSVRIVAALMLALGPYFVLFLLFENMRSLFEGWIRVLAFATIAAIGVTIGLAFELALLEPWLAGVLARRAAGEALPTAPTELFVITMLFVVVILALVGASVRLASAFRLAPLLQSVVAFHRSQEKASATSISAAGRANEPAETRSRATATANVITSLQRRDPGGRETGGDHRTQIQPRLVVEGDKSGGVTFNNIPTGRAFPRRTKARASASVGRRDRGR